MNFIKTVVHSISLVTSFTDGCVSSGKFFGKEKKRGINRDFKKGVEKNEEVIYIKMSYTKSKSDFVIL